MAQEAAEHVRSSEEGAVGRRRAAQHQVVAPSRADMGPVHLELLRHEALPPGRVVELFALADGLPPGARRHDVDLDHARIGRDPELADPRIHGRRIALELDRKRELRSDVLDGRDELDEGLEASERRQEDLQLTAAGLDAERASDDPVGRLLIARRLESVRHCPDLRGTRCEVGGPLLPLASRLHSRTTRLAVPSIPPSEREVLARGQGGALDIGVELEGDRAIVLGDPGERIERESVAHRRVARDQVAALRAYEPLARSPLSFMLERQDPSDDPIESLVEDAGQPLPLDRIVEMRLQRVDVRGQTPFPPEVIPDVFVRIQQSEAAEPQPLAESPTEARGLVGVMTVVPPRLGEERIVAPERLSILAIEAGEGPSRQLLAGVPLSLTVLEQATGGPETLQAPGQPIRDLLLPAPERLGVPLGRIRVVRAHEGRLASDGQADVGLPQRLVDPVSE